MLSSHFINRLPVYVDYANEFSPTFESVMIKLARFFISDLDRRRLKDYLNNNFDSISGIRRCVSSSQKYATFTVSIGARKVNSLTVDGTGTFHNI